MRRSYRATSSAPSEVIEKSGLITVGLTKLFGACFAFALLLAVVGTYGLMSASIGLRTREIGVRRALGASEGMATRMLLTQGARQLGVGTLIAAPVLVVIGVAAASLFPLGAAVTATRPACPSRWRSSPSCSRPHGSRRDACCGSRCATRSGRRETLSPLC